MGDERRTNPRIVSVNLVSCKPQDDFPGGERLGRTRNISIGGILLEVSQFYPLSSVIELHIALGEKILKPVGRVVRLQELEGNLVEMGVKFTEISQTDRENLKAYIDSLA